MALTRATVRDAAAAYDREEPLAVVEAQHVETLPTALSSGEFGRRDGIWVVRWFRRRYFDALPASIPADLEDRFETNGYREVVDAVTAAGDALEGVEGSTDATGLEPAVDHLRTLEGVDVSVASAFCFFLDPDRFLVMSHREWTALYEAGELETPYPDSPTVADYETYLETVRSVADRLECALWTLYRALWRLGRP